MLRRIFSSPLTRLIVGFVFVLAGIAIVMGGSVYGINYADSPYMLFNVRNPERGPVAMLTFVLAHKWCDIFGLSIGSLCWLRSLCNIMTFGIGCIWFAFITHRYLRASALFLVLCGLGEFCIAHYFNWDIAVYPWYVINAVLALEYLRRPSWIKLVLMGALVGLITLARVPAILCAVIDVVVVIYVWYRAEGTPLRLTCEIAVGVFSAIAVALGVIMLMCHSVGEYIESFVPENLINGHFDLDSLYFRLGLFIPVTAAWGGTLALIGGAYFAKVSRSRLWIKILVLFLTYNICWNTARLVDMAALTVAVFGIGQMLFAAATVCIWMRTDSDKIKFALLVIMAYAFSALLGSDTPAEKFLGLPMLPLVMAYLDYKDVNIRSIVNILMLELAIMGIYRQGYIFYNISKGDKSIYVKCDELPNVGTQYIPKEDMVWLEWAIDGVDAKKQLLLNNFKVGYMGGYSMMGEGYLGDTTPEWMNEFWIYPDDKVQRERFYKYFLEKDCILYPSAREPFAAGYVLIDDFVEEYGYEVRNITDKCLIAIPPGKVDAITDLLEFK
ncbi:MAG: hypothetical protein K2L14_01680 [Duncaniella sp.]|nr:hypothetical protein [Duncaniella sp.]